jgi:hypothetical protein
MVSIQSSSSAPAVSFSASPSISSKASIAALAGRISGSKVVPRLAKIEPKMRRVAIWDNKKRRILKDSEAPFSKDLRAYFNIEANRHCIVCAERRHEPIHLSPNPSDDEVKNLNGILGERRVSLWDQKQSKIIPGQAAHNIVAFLNNPKNAHLIVYVPEGNSVAAPATIRPSQALPIVPASGGLVPRPSIKRKYEGEDTTAAKRINLISPPPESTAEVEKRQVAIWDTQQKIIITGPDAPTAEKLCAYLKDNPHCRAFIPVQRGTIPTPQSSFSMPASLRQSVKKFEDRLLARLVYIWDKTAGKRVRRRKGTSPTVEKLLEYLEQNPNCIVYIPREIAQVHGGSSPATSRSVAVLATASASALTPVPLPAPPVNAELKSVLKRLIGPSSVIKIGTV